MILKTQKMIVQTVHEILNPFDVEVKQLGYAVALFMIVGSIHSNPQFVVRFYNTGQLRTVYGNPTAGEDLIPDPDVVTKLPANARRNTDFLSKQKDK
jgi:hypothetical protein